MNRINNLFSTKQKDILSIYFCAGYPTSDGTANVIKTLASKGIDMIEIGIPSVTRWQTAPLSNMQQRRH